ncbi:MAG TPA: VOC family protein [Nocardioidaceae bacterium]|nr:VOC family protein [Nocardioidaceae bacterium]
MSRMMFVNLPVQDLTKSAAFFASLGFEFNDQFSDDNAACMVLNDQACVMLLVTSFFADFTTKEVADAASGTEAIIAVSAGSRDEVDTLVDKALALGGAAAKEPNDQGLMYGRSFYDLDGHAWEVIWMDTGDVQ